MTVIVGLGEEVSTEAASGATVGRGERPEGGLGAGVSVEAAGAHA